MLGIKLRSEDAQRLSRLANELRRPKSSLAREWILDRLDREEIDQKIADASALDAAERAQIVDHVGGDATGAYLRWLDAEDGGYDWGPNGPPLGV